MEKALRHLKRILTGGIGFAILMLGLAMIVLPGPAFVMIPLGLAILAIESAWVRKWLRRLTGIIQRKKARIHRPPWRRIAGIHPAYSLRGGKSCQ